MNNGPTTQDVISAVTTLSDRFDGLSNRMDDGFKEVYEAISEFSTHVHERFDRVEDRLGKVETDVSALISKVSTIESTMVTKNYLDDKLADLRGHMVALTRKLNVKLSDLVEHLVEEGSLKRKTADLILAMEPFAQ